MPGTSSGGGDCLSVEIKVHSSLVIFVFVTVLGPKLTALGSMK